MQGGADTLGGHGDFEDALNSPPPDAAGSDAGVDDLRLMPLVSPSESALAGGAVPPPDPLPIVEVEAGGGHYGE